jgi:hypothetical protein
MLTQAQRDNLPFFHRVIIDETYLLRNCLMDSLEDGLSRRSRNLP